MTPFNPMPPSPLTTVNYSAEYLLLWLFWFFAPIHNTMIAIFVLIGFDIVTGAWAAIKMGHKFRSRELRKSLGKIIPYQIALLLAFTAEPMSGIPFVKVISGFIALVEFQSSIENVGRILGRDIWQEIRGLFQPHEKKP